MLGVRWRGRLPFCPGYYSVDDSGAGGKEDILHRQTTSMFLNTEKFCEGNT